MSIVRQYEEVVYLEYDPVENSFYDDDGFHVPNILDFLTPSDLCLFRNDYDLSIFTHRHRKDTVCIIAISGEEIEP